MARRQLRGLARLRLYDAAIVTGRRSKGTRGKGKSTLRKEELALRDLLRASSQSLTETVSSHEEVVRRLREALHGSTEAADDAGPDSQGSAINDSVQRLEKALRRCPECRRGKVRVLRLRRAEDLTVV
mmetsp:Transcript_104375/g.185597  ORF Transcript_104375/g.185597 Transcript_104375/m.185597 type:complete len:128 (-) Transcript_104375:6-389(-)